MIKYKDLNSHHYRDDDIRWSLKISQLLDYIENLKSIIEATNNTKLKRKLKTELAKSKKEYSKLLKL